MVELLTNSTYVLTAKINKYSMIQLLGLGCTDGSLPILNNLVPYLGTAKKCQGHLKKNSVIIYSLCCSFTYSLCHPR